MEMSLNITTNMTIESTNTCEGLSQEGKSSKEFLSLLTDVLEVLNDEKDLSDINISSRENTGNNDADLTLELKGLLNSLRFLGEKDSEVINIDQELKKLLEDVKSKEDLEVSGDCFLESTEDIVLNLSNEVESILQDTNGEMEINTNLLKKLNIDISSIKDKIENVFTSINSDIENILQDTNIGIDNNTTKHLYNNENIATLFQSLDFKDLQRLNDLSQNTNISSKLQNIILSLEGKVENKEIINIFKSLQKFTNSDGSLNLNSILNQIKLNSGNEQGILQNMNMNQQSTLGNVLNSITKEVSVFKTSDIVDVVIENFKTLRLPGRCEMTIKLNPKELGEITLRLILEKGDVSASISTNKKETFILLQNNINTFLEQLKTSETGISHLSINLNQDQDQSGEGARRGYKENKEEKENKEFEEIFMESLEENI